MPAPDDRAVNPGTESQGAAGAARAATGVDSPRGAPETASARREGSSRPTPNLLLVLAAAFLVARVATGVFEAGHPRELPELVSWLSIAEGERRAQQEPRPALYDFTADWCPPCRLMKREVFADRSAATMITGMYVPVRVLDRAREDGRNSPEVAALQARFRVKAFPTLVVVPAGGGEPLMLEGYPGRAQTIQWLSRSGIRMSVRVGGNRLPGAADSSGAR